MIYLIIFCTISILALIEVNFSENERLKPQLGYVIFGLIFILMAGTRIHTGFDYNTYHEIFRSVDYSNFQEQTVEIGFATVVLLFRNIDLSFHAFLLFIALITISLKLKYFNEYSRFSYASLLIYFSIGFIINDMGQIRYGLAIAICLFAFKDIFNENKVGFVAKVILAGLFHTSALSVLPAYWIARSSKINLKVMIGVVILLVPFLMIDIRSFLFQILEYIPIHQMRAKIRFYIFSNDYGQGLGINISFMMRLLIFAFLLLFYNRGKEKYPYFESMVKLYFLGICFYMIFNSMAELATRVSAYYKMLDCLVLPFFIWLGYTKWEKNVLSVLVILYSFWSLYKIIYSPEFGFAYNPYQSIIFNYFYE